MRSHLCWIGTFYLITCLYHNGCVGGFNVGIQLIDSCLNMDEKYTMLNLQFEPSLKKPRRGCLLLFEDLQRHQFNKNLEDIAHMTYFPCIKCPYRTWQCFTGTSLESVPSGHETTGLPTEPLSFYIKIRICLTFFSIRMFPVQ